MYLPNQETPLKIGLVICNERQDYKVDTMGGGYLWEGRRWTRRLRWRNMDGGLHMVTQNKKMKSLPIALSGTGRGSRGQDGEGDPTNVQHICGLFTMNPPCTMSMS
jgi:hypothetical protein